MITSKGIYIFFFSTLHHLYELNHIGHPEEVVQLKPGYIPGGLEAQGWLKVLEKH